MAKTLASVLKKTMIIFLFIVIILIAATYIFMKQPQFGELPKGERLERIKASPNYRDGQFQNLHHTPALAENYSMLGIIINQFFKATPKKQPTHALPHIQTNLHKLDPNQDVLVWFGHSSYFMQIDGKRMLVDPVFSGNASPIPGSMKAFKGTNTYGVEDLPEIDYLFISHDHYDHVDYKTLTALKPKVKQVICGLGVGAHLERWGYTPSTIIEKDWHDKVSLDPGFTVTLTPARHFSGRGFLRNKTLWTSFVLQTPSLKLYLGGDSGYDTHFKAIGDAHGPFDLVILENGQYNEAWPYIHNLPGQPLQAAKDLQAKRVFAVHSAKFALAQHPWDEPLTKLIASNKAYNFPLLTPMIGEVVRLKDSTQTFKHWWLQLE